MKLNLITIVSLISICTVGHAEEKSVTTCSDSTGSIRYNVTIPESSQPILSISNVFLNNESVSTTVYYRNSERVIGPIEATFTESTKKAINLESDDNKSVRTYSVLMRLKNRSKSNDDDEKTYFVEEYDRKIDLEKFVLCTETK